MGAFVTRADDLALDLARAADARVASADPDRPLPALLGTVVPVKDLDALAGVRMTGGSVVFDVVPEQDDHVVALMRAAGLVITGKTNAPEFGLPCYTEPEVAPPARTPWDLTRSAGGSSGGAGAAVAAGIASAAQGNDGGGSLRIPASVCGLVTVKPSRGRISNAPWPDSLGELTTHGPLARTVADAAALLDVMAGATPGDLVAALPPADGGSFLAAAGREPDRLRIGRYAVPVIAETEVDPVVLGVYEDASRLLESLGHVVEDVAPPFGPDQVHAFEAVWSILALGVPLDPADEVRLRPLTVADLQLITRAAKANDGLVAALMVRTAVEEPRLTMAQINAMPIGLLEFLLAEVNRVSGLAMPADSLEAAAAAPIARAAHLLARQFGWTPQQIGELTLGQILLHLQLLRDEGAAGDAR
mgnify:CR=1 FL=1